jgi:hypothetical protein
MPSAGSPMGLSPEGLNHLAGLSAQDRAIVESGLGLMNMGTTGWANQFNPSQVAGLSPMDTPTKTNFGMDELTGRYGWSPNAAAAIMGNLLHENATLNPGTVNSIGATGIGQWTDTGNRLPNMQQFTADPLTGSTPFESQIGYINQEMTVPGYDQGAYNLGQTFAANPDLSAPEMARQFALGYERPWTQSQVRRDPALQRNLNSRMAMAGSLAGTSPGSSFAETSRPQLAANTIDPYSAQPIPNPTGFDPQAAQVSALSQAMQVNPESMFRNAVPTMPQVPAGMVSPVDGLARSLFGTDALNAPLSSGVTSYPAQQTDLATPSPSASLAPVYESPDVPIGQTPQMGQAPIPGGPSPSTMAGGALSPIGYNARTQQPVDASTKAAPAGGVTSYPTQVQTETSLSPSNVIDEPTGVQPGLGAPATGEPSKREKIPDRLQQEEPSPKLPANVAQAGPAQSTAPTTGGWSIGGLIEAGKKKATEIAASPEMQAAKKQAEWAMAHPGLTQLAASLFGNGGTGSFHPSDQGSVGDWSQGGFQNVGGFGQPAPQSAQQPALAPAMTGVTPGQVPKNPDGTINFEALLAMLFGISPPGGGLPATLNA